jgi:hypothetical protein
MSPERRMSGKCFLANLVLFLPALVMAVWALARIFGAGEETTTEFVVALAVSTVVAELLSLHLKHKNRSKRRAEH